MIAAAVTVKMISMSVIAGIEHVMTLYMSRTGKVPCQRTGFGHTVEGISKCRICVRVFLTADMGRRQPGQLLGGSLVLEVLGKPFTAMLYMVCITLPCVHSLQVCFLSCLFQLFNELQRLDRETFALWRLGGLQVCFS